MLAWNRRELLDRIDLELPVCKATELLPHLPFNKAEPEEMEKTINCLVFRAQYLSKLPVMVVLPYEIDKTIKDRRVLELLELERRNDVFCARRLFCHIKNDLLWKNDVTVEYWIQDKYHLPKVGKLLSMVSTSLRSQVLETTEPTYDESSQKIGFVVRWFSAPYRVTS